MILTAGQTTSAQSIEYIGPLGKSANELPFSNAVAIDIDLESNLYIVDYARHQIFKYNQSGELLKQIGGFGNGASQFDGPTDIDASGLNVFIADNQNRRVVRLDKRLDYLSDLPSIWQSPYHFEEVISVAISEQQELFILENSEKKIIKFSRFSEPVAVFGGIFETYGQLLDPQQMVVNGSKEIYVSDPAQQLVAVYDYLGNYVTDLKHPLMNTPGAMHWGADQQLYVVNKETSTIFIFDDHQKFVTSLQLTDHVGGLRDIALYYDKRAGRKIVFALTPRQCHLYHVKPLVRN